MWTIPRHVILTAATGVGVAPLGALDSALLAAGIGDFNLVRISSIVPPGADVLYFEHGGGAYLAELGKGAFLPAVYGAITSSSPSETIASAIAIGRPRDPSQPGVIFEANIVGTQQDAIALASSMVTCAMSERGMRAFDLLTIGSEILVGDSTACAVSVACLLP